MNSIKILAHGKYLPKRRVINVELEEKFNLENGYIYKRTGIKERYFSEGETIENLALNAVKNLNDKIQNSKLKLEDVGLIITATTSSDNLMPGISNYIQKQMNIEPCICLDILAGCSGYINAFDIAKMYIETNKVKKALVIGVDILSKYTNNEDVGTAIILSDGAGATLLGISEEQKIYRSNITADGNNNDILKCKSNEKVEMNGIEIYKYAVTKTVENINQLLYISNETLDNIKYIVPHQSNIKIIKGIAARLKFDIKKVYNNIEKTGNTFCASIPIVLSEMQDKNLLQNGDKIIMIGYGGGLNTGSILLEI